MNDPRFDVIFQGKLLPGHDEESVRPGLLRFLRADEPSLARLFRSGKWLVRGNVSLGTARCYETAFRRAGAECTIEESIPRRTDQEAPPPFLTPGYLSFSPYPFSPGVFAWHRPQAVTDKACHPVFYIQPTLPIIGKGAAFLLSALLSFLMQWYLTFVIGGGFGVDDTIFLSLAIYFLGIYGLYSLLTGWKRFQFYFHSENRHRFAEMKSAALFKLRYDRYAVYDGGKNRIGTVGKDRYHNLYSATDRSGNPVFTARKPSDIRKILSDTISEIKDNYIDSEAWDMFQQFSDIGDGLKPEAPPPDDAAPLFFIFNADGQLIGGVRSDERLELGRINLAERKGDNRLLMALCLMIAGI
ncbi:hypothetical protein DENIS_4221 [Desulfonema ishimotonii]|uniref:Uncharacterized protein n=1 Tax=Desulfonema ishimotonii TaxID=45657 RepID=A0A401G1Y7_9BACT|nr:hypothetical protein [Desulfonema ishimotonii]GBC63227.1 hypothetical protein DENIS_4221 [Desulfonema ishimotonii]